MEGGGKEKKGGEEAKGEDEEAMLKALEAEMNKLNT